MPATVTLRTTTLAAGVASTDGEVKLDSTTNVVKDTRLYVDGELMRVVSVGVDSWVKVVRGVDGTLSSAHPSGVTVYVGEAHQFYTKDPVGRPPDAIPVSPYINVQNGSVWFAQGDTTSTAKRWWQRQTVTYTTGALGVRTSTLDPTSST